MESKYIQLPFGVVRNKEKEKKIQLNLPPNYKKDVLFDQLPYIAEFKNSTIKEVMRNGIVDKVTLQKYLLATGFLEGTIQDSLDMIVTDGDFNNAGIHRELDLKEQNLMKKPNPVGFVFKDKVKFDTQNPIVGKLLKETQKNKLDKNLLNKFPLVKDVKIGEQLNRLKMFNDGNNNNDNNRRLPLPPNFFSTNPAIMMMMTIDHPLMIAFLRQIPIWTLKEI